MTICGLHASLHFATMQTRKIGSLEVSVVGLGCNNFGWRIDAEASAKVIDAAIESGITFFDTADRYGKGQSEDFLGRALGPRRDQIILATKFGMEMEKGQQGASPKYIGEAIEASLRRLKTDRIDLYQVHQPDPKTPIADTLGALDQLVRAGKVREIGCSNFSVAQIREGADAAKDGAHFVSVQNEFSLFHREPEKDGVLAECEARGRAELCDAEALTDLVRFLASEFWVAHASRVSAMTSHRRELFSKDCFGERPKPTRETRTLPGTKRDATPPHTNYRCAPRAFGNSLRH